MAGTAATIRVSGIQKHKLAALRKQARALGMSTEGYARQLIEEGLILERRARSNSFDELFGPVRERFRASGMSDNELDKLVDGARTRHQRRTSRRKR